MNNEVFLGKLFSQYIFIPPLEGNESFTSSYGESSY